MNYEFLPRTANDLDEDPSYYFAQSMNRVTSQSTDGSGGANSSWEPQTPGTSPCSPYSPTYVHPRLTGMDIEGDSYQYYSGETADTGDEPYSQTYVDAGLTGTDIESDLFRHYGGETADTGDDAIDWTMYDFIASLTGSSNPSTLATQDYRRLSLFQGKRRF